MKRLFLSRLAFLLFSVPILMSIGAQLLGVSAFWYFPVEANQIRRTGLWLSQMALLGMGSVTAGVLYNLSFGTTPFMMKAVAVLTTLRFLFFAVGVRDVESETSFIQLYVMADAFFLGATFCFLLIFLKQQFKQNERSRVLSMSYLISVTILFLMFKIVPDAQDRLYVILFSLLPLWLSSFIYQTGSLLPVDIKVSPTFYIPKVPFALWSVLAAFSIAGEYRYEAAKSFHSYLYLGGVALTTLAIFVCGRQISQRINQILAGLCLYALIVSFFFPAVILSSILMRLGIFLIFCLLLVRLTSGHDIGKTIGIYGGIMLSVGNLVVLLHPVPYMNLVSLFLVFAAMVVWRICFRAYVYQVPK